MQMQWKYNIQIQTQMDTKWTRVELKMEMDCKWTGVRLEIDWD